MINKYSGDVPLVMSGRRYLLRYDWAALAAIKSELGDDVGKIVVDQDPQAMARLIAIGLRRHHPEVTADDVMRLSPAMAPAATAVGQAITIAWHGAEDPDVSANPPMGRATKLILLFKQLLKPPPTPTTPAPATK